jgi:hypothetical protein
MDFFPRFPFVLTDMSEIGTEDLHIVPFSIWEFRKIDTWNMGVNELHTFLHVSHRLCV